MCSFKKNQNFHEYLINDLYKLCFKTTKHLYIVKLGSYKKTNFNCIISGEVRVEAKNSPLKTPTFCCNGKNQNFKPNYTTKKIRQSQQTRMKILRCRK